MMVNLKTNKLHINGQKALPVAFNPLLTCCSAILFASL